MIDDHTRVTLTELEGSPGSDYINANFIDVSNQVKNRVTIIISLLLIVASLSENFNVE